MKKPRSHRFSKNSLFPVIVSSGFFPQTRTVRRLSFFRIPHCLTRFSIPKKPYVVKKPHRITGFFGKGPLPGGAAVHLFVETNCPLKNLHFEKPVWGKSPIPGFCPIMTDLLCPAESHCLLKFHFQPLNNPFLQTGYVRLGNPDAIRDFLLRFFLLTVQAEPHLHNHFFTGA